MAVKMATKLLKMVIRLIFTSGLLQSDYIHVLGVKESNLTKLNLTK